MKETGPHYPIFPETDSKDLEVYFPRTIEIEVGTNQAETEDDKIIEDHFEEPI